MKIALESKPSKSYIIKIKHNKDYLEEAEKSVHKEYINKRNDAIFNLLIIANNKDIPAIYRKQIRDAANILLEGE